MYLLTVATVTSSGDTTAEIDIARPTGVNCASMPKSLVIVESPTKARTIASFLGSDATVESSMGHIRDLPRSAADIPAKVKGEDWARLGVNVERDFEPLYIVPPEKRKVVKELKDDLKSTVADLANVSGSRYAGMLVAGTYLREFVADVQSGAYPEQRHLVPVDESVLDAFVDYLDSGHGGRPAMG